MKLIGKGRTADVYYHEGKAIKVFSNDISDEWVAYEYKVNEIASKSLGPKVYSMDKLDDKKAISFEYIDGELLSEHFKNHMSRCRSLGKVFGTLHYRMHQNKADELIDQKTYFSNQLKKIKILDEDIKERLLNHLDTLEDGHALCHGDYHIENIIISDTWRIIDWTNAYSGNPLSDVARTYMILKSPYVKTFVPWYLRGGLNTVVSMFTMHYFRSYRKESDITFKKMRVWLPIIYACRLNENIKEEKSWLLSQLLYEMNKQKI